MTPFQDNAENNRANMTDRTIDQGTSLNPQVSRVEQTPTPSDDRKDAAISSPALSSNDARQDIAGSIGPSGVSRLVTPAPNQVATPRTPTHLSREQILDATAACLAELGYDGTTIRRIAKQLDCAVGSIYRYFDDKRALLAAVVQRRFQPIIDRITEGAPIDAVADLYAMTAGEQSELYRLMFWLASVGKNDKQANTVPPAIREIIDGWAVQIGDKRVAESYWSQLHGAIMLGRRVDDVPVPTLKG